ncbi:hypothetical protein FACS1894139_15840 [Planctomycetales bacterium]|nr:hypothetical protein FACS1894139_15840 [Planctomycetales bacterium]
MFSTTMRSREIRRLRSLSAAVNGCFYTFSATFRDDRAGRLLLILADGAAVLLPVFFSQDDDHRGVGGLTHAEEALEIRVA